MAQSPQGKLMTPLLCKLRYALYMPVYLLSFLPEGLKASLVRFALRGMKTCDESSITTSINLFSVDCIGGKGVAAVSGTPWDCVGSESQLSRTTHLTKAALKLMEKPHICSILSGLRIVPGSISYRAVDIAYICTCKSNNSLIVENKLGKFDFTVVKDEAEKVHFVLAEGQHLVHGKPRNDEGGGKRQYNHKAKFKEDVALVTMRGANPSGLFSLLEEKQSVFWLGMSLPNLNTDKGMETVYITVPDTAEREHSHIWGYRQSSHYIRPVLIFYYGTGDRWCPQHYYDEIKMDFPDGDIRLCEKGLRHAFVLDASKEMAAMITDWLQDDLTKL
ncbi:hypothetical protein TURU_037679 [Turdus rufiventris]|nr:hypothetical protein TURU_037679 [Turdus rufiventris]